VGSFLAILVISQFFTGGNSEDTSATYLNITPYADSTVYISMSSSSKTRISQTEKLYATDKSVSVQVGGALAENSDLKVDLDKTTELTYKKSSLSGNLLTLSK
jgi:hypothetical protein